MREGGVAQPAVAVVPVALAAEVLGQRGGGRGDDAAGRRVREQAQRDQRAAGRRSACGRSARHSTAHSSSSSMVSRIRSPRSARCRERRTCDGTHVVEKTSSSPARDVEVVVVPVVGGDRQPGTAQDQLVRAADRGDHLLAADLLAAHPRPDLAVVEADHPLVAQRARRRETPVTLRTTSARPSPRGIRSVSVDDAGGGGERRLQDPRGAEVAARRRRTSPSGPAASGRGPRCRGCAAKQAGESKRGRHSQSIEPLRPTRAAVCRSPISA